MWERAMPYEYTVQDIATEAVEVEKLLALDIDAIAECAVNDPTERQRSASSLLRSSMDQGRAIACLLAQDPREFGGVVGALHRIHIEHFVRGAYFGLVANDREVQKFTQSGDLPQVAADTRIRNQCRHCTPKKRATRNMHFKEMLAAVDRLMHQKQSRLVEVVGKKWGDLNDFAHGGKLVLEIYQQDEHGIGAYVSLRALGGLLASTTVLSMNTCAYWCLIARIPTDQALALVRASSDRIAQYIAQRSSRYPDPAVQQIAAI